MRAVNFWFLGGLLAVAGCGESEDEGSCPFHEDASVEDETKKSTANGSNDGIEGESLIYPEEVHFSNMRQLTFGGDNAEAYWSFDSESLVFQATNPQWNLSCDQIFVMELGKDKPSRKPPTMVSTGYGRTTCAYFMPGDKDVVYASTHLADSACPDVPHRGPEGEYVWPVYEGYDIFVVDIQGENLRQLTNEPGYDAEATVSPKGDRMVFTSTRDGDLDLYTMALDGSDVQRVTHELGYDGGAFFSPDGQWLIWRASRPEGEQADLYKGLLERGLVQPTAMELFIGRVDGSEQRQLTHLGGANWAPYFHPSGEKVLFCSNHQSGKFPFNLFMIDLDGTNLEQITFDSDFDSFPMFSPDGKRIAFSSNRNNGRTRNTNMFVADWVD
jgi:TolB protein